MSNRKKIYLIRLYKTQISFNIMGLIVFKKVTKFINNKKIHLKLMLVHQLLQNKKT